MFLIYHHSQAKQDLANVEIRWIQKQKDAVAVAERAVRSEMQVVVDAAKRETAEYLELYTKVLSFHAYFDVNNDILTLWVVVVISLSLPCRRIRLGRWSTTSCWSCRETSACSVECVRC